MSVVEIFGGARVTAEAEGITENRELKKKEIQFFPSKTYIVDECFDIFAVTL